MSRGANLRAGRQSDRRVRRQSQSLAGAETGLLDGNSLVVLPTYDDYASRPSVTGLADGYTILVLDDGVGNPEIHTIVSGAWYTAGALTAAP